MNRTILMIAAMFSASSLLLVDSAVKGTALLVLAGVTAMILRRDSAATRHLVWLLAVVAMLVVPVLSAMLPQWRVLPEWAGVPPKAVLAAARPPSIAGPAVIVADLPRNSQPVEVEWPSATAYPPAAEAPDSRPASATPKAIAEPAVRSWNWNNALPLVWAIGFSVLILRLFAARWMLRSSESRGTVIWSSARPVKATHDPIVTALKAARSQLGIGGPITLLIHPDKTIPVVWGIFRCRLLLPASARQWSGEQLRSVLLHELAHSKRRDTVAQLLAQVACALHWFNPLVWLAAWRLSVERERACDDLVLAGGVRPSAYAGHLVAVVTELSPARGTQSCGLAMARKSSLEGRLLAVLSKNQSRRGVSVALAAIALAMTVGIAVPVAMLRAAEEKPAEKPKPAASDTKPAGSVKLKPGTEEKLKWGETVNGLRSAVVFRPSSDKPKAGDLPDLYLAVLNVSDAPIRLSDTDVPADVRVRELLHKNDARIVYIMGAREPALGDLKVQPREVAFLPMFDPDKKFAATGDPTVDGHTLGQTIAEGVLKNSHESLVIHMLIEKAPAGAWTGKLVTGDASGYEATGQPQPKDKEGQALFKKWQEHARGNGNIPGGLVGRLGEKMKEFISLNTGDKAGDPYAKKMAPLVPRCDATRDWTPAEIVALMDDITAITPIPLHTMMDETAERTLKMGEPLPPTLANAPWGEAKPEGLRMAWLLEPRAAEYHLGTPLKSRILLHNSGKNAIVFRTRTFHQVGHTALDAKGADIKVSSVEWTAIGQFAAFRLEPGEFVEVTGPGVGVGAMGNPEDWQNTPVGSWVEAKQGDDVTLTTAPILVSNTLLSGPVSEADWKKARTQEDEPEWWLGFITARLSRELPLPASADERTRLLNRAVRDLFGAAPTAEETAAFLADGGPNALDSLAKRLEHRPGLTTFSGKMTSGPTKFRVLAADPDAAKKPRTAAGPGHYRTLGGNAYLVVTRRSVGERIVNEALIIFTEPSETIPTAHEIKLPDGYNTWSAAWMREGTVIWVMQRGNVRSYDFTDHAQVKETSYEGDNAANALIPPEIREALRAALPLPGAPKPAAATPK